MTPEVVATEAILARLEGLEHQTRVLARQSQRWRLATMLSCILAGAAVIVGPAVSQDKGKTVAAERFVLMDPTGKIRASLSVRTDGEPALQLRDSNGKLRASLGLEKDGQPALRLRDANEKLRSGLIVLSNGEPSFGLWDANGKALFSRP